MAALPGASASSNPSSPFRVLTLSDEGWKNLSIFDEDGRRCTSHQGGGIHLYTFLQHCFSYDDGGLNGVLAIIEWGGKYNGKESELRELLPSEEWQ
jgi:hypothetical protein